MNKEELAAAKTLAANAIGLIRLTRGVMCEGCKRNVTRKQDKFGKHFCQLGKDCKAMAAAFYASQGIAPTLPAAAAPSAATQAPSGNAAVAALAVELEQLREKLRLAEQQAREANAMNNDDAPEEESSSEEEVIVSKKTRAARAKRSNK